MAKKSIKESVKSVMSSVRANESCKAKLGIEVKYNGHHLVKMTNVTWQSNGIMRDATCHYISRIEIHGNTYPWRALFKKWGLKWDAGHECWWMPSGRTGGSVSKVTKALLKWAATH